MIRLDGSFGSGGGQILRTALSLSAYTGKPFSIERIRASRPNPGLAAQHLACVEGVAELCGAEVRGAEIGSTELLFRPGEPGYGEIEVDIGTAGSVALLLQAAVLPASVKGAKLTIIGGTDVKWSPTWDYVVNVTIPLAEKAGLYMLGKLLRRGHYPEGGGRVEVEVEPWRPSELVIAERGELLYVEGVSHASNLPAHVAERQAAAAAATLEGLDVDVEIEVVRDAPAESTGTGITLWASYDGTVLGGSAIGERGKPAEDVGVEAARELLDEVERAGTVDRYAGDQLLPLVATGGGRYVATERTEHLETNADTCGRFVERTLSLTGEGPVAVESDRAR
ncbi:MAG: RNA 3'-terminal phosphate cyclase [Methanonatronarchaeales archaeon]|nr:RNA 3'-terminal phosphate cyclase [Methanonatronarchaeales archaeon]